MSFKEGQFDWKMLLIFNLKAPYGAFWFLLQDNENSSFNLAIYAIRKYGSGRWSEIF